MCVASFLQRRSTECTTCHSWPRDSMHMQSTASAPEFSMAAMTLISSTNTTFCRAVNRSPPLEHPVALHAEAQCPNWRQRLIRNRAKLLFSFALPRIEDSGNPFLRFAHRTVVRIGGQPIMSPGLSRMECHHCRHPCATRPAAPSHRRRHPPPLSGRRVALAPSREAGPRHSKRMWPWRASPCLQAHLHPPSVRRPRTRHARALL